MQRRLAAILVADVVGSSRLIERDEARALAAIRDRWTSIVEPLVKEHGGRVVKYTGDGVLAEFGSAADAVTCGLRIQDGMIAANTREADGGQIHLRIGINVGDVVDEGGDILGDGVNIAARVEAFADPGALCLTAAAHEAIRGKIAVRSEDLGERVLKNIERPVRLWRLGPDAAGAPVRSSAAAPRAPQLVSIAVLPFTNMSADREQEYFADGLTEDLITALAKSKHLLVYSRNATFRYKGQSVSISEVARELGALYVVEGSVRTGGGRVRVTAQLIRADSGGHVWAQRFDRDPTDIFAVQDEIVDAISGQLSYGLVDAAAASRRNAPTESLTAYDHLLRGRAAWRRGAVLETHNHYQKAVQADPDYGAALASLGFVCSFDLYAQLLGQPLSSLETIAWASAERAVSVDDGDPFTHHSVGNAYLCLGALERARNHLEKAISLNPHFPSSWINLGYAVASLGDHQGGLDLIARGSRLEPRLPPSMQAVALEVYCNIGDWRAARAAFASIESPFAFHCLMLAGCLAHAGQMEEAKQALAVFEERRTRGFDVGAFIRIVTRQYRLPSDLARILEGYGRLGLVP